MKIGSGRCSDCLIVNEDVVDSYMGKLDQVGVQAFLIVNEDVVDSYMGKLDQVGVQAFVSAGG